jgi:diadenosine tetraphosphate (Ap4A) HIT family hydrolase
VTGCHTCELAVRRDSGEAAPWELIARSGSWDVAHAYGTAVDGWLVLVARRHITALADMTDDEARDLGPLVRAVSAALREAVGCVKTYVAQFAEDPRHPHVHVHVIPRRADQPAELTGPRIFSQLGVPEERCVREDRMNEIAAAIRGHLLSGAQAGLRLETP